MRDLIERIEAATGPDRELFEEAFAVAFGPEPESKYDGRAWKRGEPDFAPEWSAYIERRCRYLQLVDAEAWLDAAMALVPEGCDRADHVWPDNEGRFCTYLWAQRKRHQVVARARAATPPLALCAAALRAREQEA